MSTGAAIAIAVGGTVLMAVGITWMVLRFNREYHQEENVIEARMREGLPRLGWSFTKRDDSVAELYSRQMKENFHRNPFQPFDGPPKAWRANNIITGVHRGRPFLAAKLAAVFDGEAVSVRWVAVRTPAVRPGLTVRRSQAVASAVNNALWGEVRIGHPEFDQKFDVKSHDPRFAAAVLSPALAEFLLRDPRTFKGFYLLADHIEVFDSYGDYRDPANLIPALDLRCDILDRIPAAAWA